MIEYFLNHDLHLTVCTLSGIVTLAEVRKFQFELWSIPLTGRYDCLIDISPMDSLELLDSGAETMNEITTRVARLDTGTIANRLFLVAPKDWQYGLARMYSQYRMMKHRRRTYVVRSMTRAFELLALERGL